MHPLMFDSVNGEHMTHMVNKPTRVWVQRAPTIPTKRSKSSRPMAPEHWFGWDRPKQMQGDLT